MVETLKSHGIFVAIVSAGVDLFVSSIAAMLKVDDWIANGFVFNDDETLSDEGVCRLHATGKGEVISRLLKMNNLDAEGCVSVGDSEMDLSMHIEGSRFLVSILHVRVLFLRLKMRGSTLSSAKT